MKKGIIILFVLCCMNLLGAEYQNNLGDIHTRMNLSRGEEQFRTNVIHKKIGMAGRSNSSQYIDFVGYSGGRYNPDGVFSKTKSFLVGTNSNLVKHPNVFAGISLGNFKSRLVTDNNDYKTRSLGFNYFLGYDKENTIFITKFGFNKSKNFRTRRRYKSDKWLLDTEVGHIFEVAKNSTVYPFASLGVEHCRVKSHEGIPQYSDNIPNLGTGVNLFTIVQEKLQVSATAKWNYKLKKQRYYLKNNVKENMPKSYGELGVQLGYFLDPDFLITLRYSYLFDKNYNYNLVGIGLLHNF